MQKEQNLTPDSFGTVQLAGMKRKRSRPPLSCQPCRLRKVACDRKEPCNNCSRQGKAIECIYGTHEDLQNEPTKDMPGIISFQASKATNDVSATAHKLQRLEYLVGKLTDTLDGQKPKFLPSVAYRNNEGGPLTGAARGGGRSDGRNNEGSNVYSDCVMTTKIPSGRTYFIGRTSWTMAHYETHLLFVSTTFADQWNACRELGKRFKGRGGHSLINCAMVTPASSTMESELLDMIPERSISDVLVQRFLVTFNTTHPVVNPERLQAEVEAFWDRQEIPSSTWIALFLCILGLGLQLPVISFPRGKSISQTQKRAKRILSAVKSQQFGSPSQRPDLRAFQTLLLLILSQSLMLDWVDGNDAISGLLGIASRMAFTMGLHRDPRVGQGIAHEDGDMRRTLWITFTFIDFEHCFQTGMPFLLRSADSDVDPPAPINATGYNYQQHISLALPIWAQALQITHSKRVLLHQHDIVELQAQIRSLRLPPMPEDHEKSAKLGDRIQSSVQCSLIDCINERLIIMLNSPFINHTHDEEKRNSREAVLESGRSVLRNHMKLRDLYEDVEHPCRDAWVYFSTTLLHCYFYYATGWILELLRRTMEEQSGGLRSQQLRDQLCFLLGQVRSMPDSLEYALRISPAYIREHMVLKATLAGAEVRMMLHSELGKKGVSLSDEETAPVIRAMQQAMERSLKKAEAAIDFALSTNDPPMSLIEDSDFNQSLPPQQTGVRDVVTSTAEQGALTYPESSQYQESTSMNGWVQDFDLFPDTIDLSWLQGFEKASADFQP